MATELPGRCRHFLTYSGVKLPLSLSTPLEPAQIANRNTYFRGYFDEEDRMVGLQKIVYGEVEFQHRYHYGEGDTLRRAEITDIEGEVIVLHFDATGTPQRG